MSRIRCFLLSPVGRVSVELRRYTRENTPDCCPVYPGKWSYHTASNWICDEPIERDEDGYIANGLKALPSPDDPRWPRTCACGYVFEESDEWQRFVKEKYQRVDTGEEITI